MVGGTNPNGIVIDATAAGYGWFVDRTPRNSVEFLGGARGQARGRVDLLTVIAHEMGNVLGLPETTGNGIMGRDLAVGTRRVPVSADLAAQADRPTSLQPALAVGSTSRLNRPGFLTVPDDLATEVAGATAPWTRSMTARRKGR